MTGAVMLESTETFDLSKYTVLLVCVPGLDLQKDKVIEIACLITDGRLRDPVEVSSCYVQKT